MSETEDFPQLLEQVPASAEEIEAQQNDDIMRTFCYNGVFKPDECDAILAAARDPRLSAAFLEAQRHHMDGFHKFMRCQPELIAVSEETRWLHRYLHKMMLALNHRHYHFDLHRVIGTQLVTLSPESALDWHFDLGQGMFAYRKLSLAVYLSAPEDYEGGILEVMSHGLPRVKRVRGSLAVYPAYCASRFTPVIRGELKLLLTWMHGEKLFT